MSTEKRQPGRPKSKKDEEKAMHHGTLSGNAAKLYNALSSKTLGLSAAIRMLAKSEYAGMFFDDMDTVRQVNISEAPTTRNTVARQYDEYPNDDEKVYSSHDNIPAVVKKREETQHKSAPKKSSEQAKETRLSHSKEPDIFPLADEKELVVDADDEEQKNGETRTRRGW
jgi:hypothetical protein